MTRWTWALGLVAGCSFALTGPDPRAPRTQEPKCDRDKTTVVLDSVLATAAGVTTLAVGADSGGGAAIIPALLGSVFVGAAIHGNTVVNRCRAANEEYLATRDAAPPPPTDVEDRKFEKPVTSPVAIAPPPPPVAAPVAPPPPPAPPDSWADFWKEVR